MPDTTTDEEIQGIYEAFEQLRAANNAKESNQAFSQLTKMLDLAGLLPSVRGRTPESLPTYTFANGAVATVHRIGQMTIAHVAQAAQKKFPAIPVPTFDVDDLKNQPNPADPTYQAAVAERAGRINLAIMDTLMEMAVDIEIDQAALDQLNATLALVSMPLDEISPKVAFIKHICITDGSELAKLGNLIRGELGEAIEAAEATFPGDVPGPAAEPLQPAAIRSPLLA